MTTWRTNIIERRQTFTFGATLNATGTFKKNIQLNFITDEMKVINVIYVAPVESGLSFLYLDIV